jgi:hypothetical protein
MATETYYLTGTAYFPRLTKVDQYDNFSIGVDLDADSKAVYAESGMQMSEKAWQDKKFYTFRRPAKKVMKDELVKFGPPAVFDTNKQPINALLGNGSNVTVKVVVYDTIKGKGHRLEAIRVNNLIEFKPTPQDGSAPKATAAMPF